jgi:hypothetical protein
MPVPTVALGSLAVSRLLIGGNPFSGFSHQSQARSAEMAAWYTEERIVETLFQAQELGLTACICRGDDHIVGVLKRYWAQGGTLRWVAQTNSRAETAAAGARYCIENGAAACYLHGGIMDHYVAQGRYDDIHAFVETVQAAKLPVGVAGHLIEDFRWAEEHLALDFNMVSYYNPSPRQDVPHHDPAAAEQFLEEDRQARVALIASLQRPVIHYKVLAAGRNEPTAALAFAAQQLRPQDAICLGIYTRDNPHMLAEDLALLQRHW